MIVVLQGKSIHTREDLHEAFAKELRLPEYYGKNLDALRDCLTGCIDLPLTLVWLDFNTSQQALGEYADRVVQTLREAEIELPGFQLDLR